MTRQVPVKRISLADAKLYLGKADEHLDSAKDSLGLRRWTAAATLAVHAGINACDAITGARLGKRASGTQHEQTLILLKDVPEAKDTRRLLRPLLGIKPRAEYDAVPLKQRDAQRAVEQASQLVELAHSVIEATGANRVRGRTQSQ
jgi:HEPN domain-containing protein